MSTYTMHVGGYRIGYDEFNSISPNEDIINAMEVDKPMLRQSLISGLDKHIKLEYSNNWDIVDIKYIRKDESSPTKYLYLAKEKHGLLFRYMKYCILVSPIEFYTNESLIKARMDRLHKSIKCTRPMSTDECVEEFVRKYMEGICPFTVTDWVGVRSATNDVCTKVVLQSEIKMLQFCNRTIREYCSLSPFCQVCGKIGTLWRFGNIHIYCETCFVDTFNEYPVEFTSKRVLLHEAISSLRDVSYSEYVRYICKQDKKTIEYIMFDEDNYYKGRKYLSSPNLQEIASTLTKKQNNRLYVLAKFFTLIIISEKGGINSPSINEYIYLLTNCIRRDCYL